VPLNLFRRLRKESVVEEGRVDDDLVSSLEPRRAEVSCVLPV